MDRIFEKPRFCLINIRFCLSLYWSLFLRLRQALKPLFSSSLLLWCTSFRCFCLPLHGLQSMTMEESFSLKKCLISYCGVFFRKCAISFKEMLDFLIVEAPIGNVRFSLKKCLISLLWRLLLEMYDFL